MWDSILGGAVSGGLSLLGQTHSAREASKSVDKQMKFQERMSNTAYQRQIADMKKAGINPNLLYMKGAGQGATSPSGASYTPPDYGTSAKTASSTYFNSVHAKIDIAKNAQELLNMQTQNQLNYAEIRKVMADVGIKLTQLDKDVITKLPYTFANNLYREFLYRPDSAKQLTRNNSSIKMKWNKLRENILLNKKGIK